MNVYDSKSKENQEYEYIISKEDPDIEWDDFVENSKDGNYEQTSLWAGVKKKYGWTPIRIILKKNKKTIAGAQILYKKTKLGNIGYLSKGPVLSDADSHEIENIFLYLYKITRINRIIFLYINPPIDIVNFNSDGFKHKLSPDYINQFIGATSIIELEKDADALLRQMKKSTKRNIKRAQEKNILIRKGERHEISDFFLLMLATCKRQGVTPNPPDEKFFYELWDRFHFKRAIHLFFAEYKDEKVATALSISFGDRLSFWKIGWSGKHKERKPNDLLHWEIIKWSKHHGYKYFDFIGIDRKLAESIISGQSLPKRWKSTVTHFKLGFGGKIKLLPNSYVYIYNPILRFLYENCYPKVKKVREMEKFPGTIGFN